MKLALVAAMLGAAALASAAGAGPLRTAVFAPGASATEFDRIAVAGATMVRINLSWAQVAPTPPAAPTNPSDPAYRWDLPDAMVERAAAHGLTPLVTVYDAPRWAEKDEPHPTRLGPYPIASWKPDARAFGSFARALATRYNGSFAGLPRVRYWEVWDEPNLSQYLSPQVENGKVVSPNVYRGLVNAFAASAHTVRADNLVAAGSLSAFSFLTRYGRLGISPLRFMRRLLCMSAGARPKPTCRTKVEFDAWSHHPWTSGSPTHHATEKGDVSFGDLPELKRLLSAAGRAGHIRSPRPPELWITEFAWDTRPPDPHPEAAPIGLQSRWVAEALHRSWQLGITVFTWLTLWDQPYPASSLQSGLYFRNGEDFGVAQAKPTFYAFRFPFVAYRAGKRISIWGRTPFGRRGRVTVQQRRGSKWRSLGTFATDRYGVFKGRARYRPAVKASAPARPEASAARYHDLVVSAGPTSYWPLDERSGVTAADTMKADPGHYTGDVRFGVPGALPGTTAIGFDGQTARVQLGRMTNVHSVELWVKSSSPIYGGAFSNRSAEHAFTFLGGNGGLAFSFDDYAIFGAPVSNGRWHHVVYTYDSALSIGKLYVDGVLSSFAVYKRSEGGAAASIGYDRALNTYFKGQLDEVAVYRYPLSLEQVRAHYRASGRRIPASVPTGMLRAVETRSGMKSLPFSLRRPADRFVLPFGGGGPGF